jgi:hypothetical protein
VDAEADEERSGDGSKHGHDDDYGADTKSSDERSEYERKRDENIARNQLMFAELAKGYEDLFDNCRKSKKKPAAATVNGTSDLSTST